MTAASLLPEVLDALISAGRALLDEGIPDGHWTTTDGPDTSGDTGNFLMVGVDSLEPLRVPTASGEQTWPLATNHQRAEDIKINCCLWARDGAADLKTARAVVFDAYARLGDHLRNNPTLDVAGVIKTTLGADLDFTQERNDSGAEALLVFRVAYQARLIHR